jgi:hypothetical protein
MPPPRANFACLSAKCQQDGAASIYELPISATRCPVCGSKKVRRLFDAVQIGSGDARAHAALVEQSSIPAQAAAAKERKDFTLRGEELQRGGGSAAGALGVVQATGASAASRRTIGLMKALGPMRPMSVRDH